jgi:GNAT superfamily N-acetyltransferase
VTPVRVVDADLEDPVHCQGILEVVDSYARDPRGGGQGLAVDVRDRLIDGLRAHPTTRVFLAFAEDRPIGVAVCFLGFSTFSAKPLLNIHDLAVLPPWRGKGVGRALLAAVEQHARGEDCCKLTLEVLDDNTPARGLYASVGFTDDVFGSSTSMRFLTKTLEA